MQPLERGIDGLLEQIWEPNRDYLRRFLIGLSRDIDLADDLLQETYLHARAGVNDYRGGEARAWLAAIARNTFYAHARRPSTRTEVPLDFEPGTDNSASNGSSLHLDCIQLREAISNLSPALRSTLIMKHYGGFTYQEIAQRQGCPAGTARRRVWTAMQKLRAALVGIGEEAEMTCDRLRGTLMLDYIYGALSKRRAAAIEAHLKGCAACRKEVAELKKVMAALDETEGDYKSTQIIDLDETGLPMEYSWASMVNSFGETTPITWWTANKDHIVDFVMLQGKEATLDVLPYSDSQYWYEGRLPKPVESGKPVHTLLVLHPAGPEGWAEKLGEGRWRYSFQTTPNSAKEWVYVLAIRLPTGARLVSASPEPSKSRSNGLTTLVWQALLPRVQRREDGSWPWQFECAVEYDLDEAAGRNRAAGAEQRESPVRWAPRVAFEIADMPCMGAGERALDLFIKARDLPSKHYRTWFRLGLALYDGGYYEEALEAFRRVGVPDLRVFLDYPFAARAWQGHVLDLLGRREEALERYRQALALNPSEHTWVQHGQYDMTVNRAWVEDRLKTPFERK